MRGMDAPTPTPLNKLVASEIRAWLGRRQLTGRQLAAKLGASQTWTATRLRGEQEITLTDLERIAAALGVEVATLLPAPARKDGSHMAYSPASVAEGPRSGHLVVASAHPIGHTPPDPPPHHRATGPRSRRAIWRHDVVTS